LRYAGKKSKYSIENRASNFLKESTFALGLNAIDNITCFVIHLFCEVVEPFRFFLKIAIDQKHPLARGSGQTCHHGFVMPEVTGEIDNDNMAIALGELYGNVEAVIRRTIVHQNDFIFIAD